ncbi:MAG: HAMP domain-containing histidine kinase [Oscillatoriales cyanobacterium RM2_1_1]|nr:HAMP domain-containing histidine kinase [Oscillatoriales cyanobacterium SM2_3_0]NJO45107.1 HAMP domain-containing histidine kinase [Oscillatoriales cyanobacterium RM2_1_1]
MQDSQFTTLSDILAREVQQSDLSASVSSLKTAWLKAEREWYGAVVALNILLEQQILKQAHSQSLNWTEAFADQGLLLSSPSPILTRPGLVHHFISHILVPESALGWEQLLLQMQSLRPKLLTGTNRAIEDFPEVTIFPLSDEDPLTQEPFCITLTPHFSLVMVLGLAQGGQPAFLFSFDPKVVMQALAMVRSRLSLRAADQSLGQPMTLAELDILMKRFPPQAPDYQTVSQFSHLLLQHLPIVADPPWNLNLAAGLTLEDAAQVANSMANPTDVQDPQSFLKNFDPELLQAIAHEVRTPLTTIRTLARLILNHRQLNPDTVRKSVEKIDQECTTQIDRFNFIFRAAELELSQVHHQKSPSPHQQFTALTPISLMDIFHNSLPRWQKQASQRNHTLVVDLPQKLPTVVSDPTLLDQVLTGVIENFTRSLPNGSHIQVGVSLAGHQLKLQLESQPGKQNPATTVIPPTPLKALGPWLVFQPETGMLSLNLDVTKNLFQALGGKLVVRQRPRQGEVMTIFCH